MKVQLKKLPEQVMVITGATSGIGLATARKAAKRGARLVLAARNEDALQRVSSELSQHGCAVEAVAADVARAEQVRAIADAALRRFGGFDSWLNLAGVGIFGKSEDVTLDDMHRLFDINYWGVVHGSLAAAPHLKACGGALINMGSEASDRAVPLQGIYSASKHAVKGFTDALRVELEEQGAPVAVTLIKPASIDTMFVAHAKNYLDVEPRLPPTVYAPEIVADALLYAATHPTRDMHVGLRARLIASGEHFVPRLLDKGMQRWMYRLIKTDQPAGRRDNNSLYSYQDDLQERGGVGWRPRETSIYTGALTHPKTTRAMALGAGLALAALWQARRHNRPAS